MSFFFRFLSKIFGLFFRILSKSVVLFLGDCIGILWFDILRIRRRLVLENLERAFPHLDLKDRIVLGRKSLKHFGRTVIEFSYFSKLNQQNIDDFFEFEGIDKLHSALSENKGVCILTCHLGAGDLATAGLSLLGFKIFLISKEFKVKWLNNWWFGLREKMGTQFIKPRNSSFEILRALKSNSVVIFVQDQFMGPPIGAKTKFFGIETGTALGLSVIVNKVKSPILPVYTYRMPNGKHKVVVESQISWEDKESKDKTLVYMTQKFNDTIEKHVKLHPDQWMWIHRRWKVFK